MEKKPIKVQIIFLSQDLDKQREEIEKLRALLIQHNIPLESEQSK